MTESTMTENTPSSPSNRRRLIYGAVILLGIFGLMQFARFIVPGFQLDNPPVMQEVVWDSPETQQLWETACADCHSNKTVYPWYSYVAPVGWLVAYDTHEGRSNLNISEDSRIEGDELVEVIQEGEMPPAIYTVMHPSANLSDTEKQALIDGILATVGR